MDAKSDLALAKEVASRGLSLACWAEGIGPLQLNLIRRAMAGRHGAAEPSVLGLDETEFLLSTARAPAGLSSDLTELLNDGSMFRCFTWEALQVAIVIADRDFVVVIGPETIVRAAVPVRPEAQIVELLTAVDSRDDVGRKRKAAALARELAWSHALCSETGSTDPSPVDLASRNELKSHFGRAEGGGNAAVLLDSATSPWICATLFDAASAESDRAIAGLAWFASGGKLRCVPVHDWSELSRVSYQHRPGMVHFHRSGVSGFWSDDEFAVHGPVPVMEKYFAFVSRGQSAGDWIDRLLTELQQAAYG